MNQEDLKTKIVNDIKKSGFLAEMKANEILVKNGWTNTHNSQTFHDKDMDKSREIDITAYNIHINEAKDIRFGVHLIIEVKKSEKPWVVFCQDYKNKRHRGLGWGILNFTDNVTSNQLTYNNINKENRFANHDFYGTSYHEAFKEPSETSQIYSALMTSCKAAVDIKKRNSWKKEDKKYDASKNHHIDFFLPIVVLSGKIFQATLDLEGEISVEEVDYVPVKLNYSSKNYKESSFYPEIVNLNGLKNHLQRIEKWHKYMFDEMLKNIK